MWKIGSLSLRFEMLKKKLAKGYLVKKPVWFSEVHENQLIVRIGICTYRVRDLIF